MGAPGCPTPTKKGHKTAANARRHMWKLLRSPKSKRREWQSLHVYKCPCGLFHVGHRRRTS